MDRVTIEHVRVTLAGQQTIAHCLCLLSMKPHTVLRIVQDMEHVRRTLHAFAMLDMLDWIAALA